MLFYLHLAGPPLRSCTRTTAATLALFWTSQLSRWLRWIRRCRLFHLAIASGTCCWGTRHFRMMTGSMTQTCLCTTIYKGLSRDIPGCVCVYTRVCASLITVTCFFLGYYFSSFYRMFGDSNKNRNGWVRGFALTLRLCCIWSYCHLIYLPLK